MNSTLLRGRIDSWYINSDKTDDLLYREKARIIVNLEMNFLKIVSSRIIIFLFIKL